MRHRRRPRPPATSGRRVASRRLPIENYPEFADLRDPAALSCVGRQAGGAEQRNDEAAAAFGSEAAYDPNRRPRLIHNGRRSVAEVTAVYEPSAANILIYR
jgi:hypothetical protein